MKCEKPFKIKIDNAPYEWVQSSIVEEELRELAGIPQNAQIFQKIPGQPDRQVKPGYPVDLTGPGPEKFCSAVVGSQAG